MKKILCNCIIFGVIGTCSFIGIAHIQGNSINTWSQNTWIAFIIVSLGFISCAIFRKNKCK